MTSGHERFPPPPPSHPHPPPTPHPHQVREVRLVRREGRGGVCLVLLRFAAQAEADAFYQDFNGRPVRRRQPAYAG